MLSCCIAFQCCLLVLTPGCCSIACSIWSPHENELTSSCIGYLEGFRPPWHLQSLAKARGELRTHAFTAEACICSSLTNIFFFFLLWAELLELRVTALFFCLSVVQKWQWRSVLVCIINHFLSFSLGLLFCPSAELETCPFSPCKILQIFPCVLGGGMPLRRQHFQLQPAGSNLKGYFEETNTNRMLR